MDFGKEKSFPERSSPSQHAVDSSPTIQRSYQSSVLLPLHGASIRPTVVHPGTTRSRASAAKTSETILEKSVEPPKNLSTNLQSHHSQKPTTVQPSQSPKLKESLSKLSTFLYKKTLSKVNLHSSSRRDAMTLNSLVIPTMDQ